MTPKIAERLKVGQRVRFGRGRTNGDVGTVIDIMGEGAWRIVTIRWDDQAVGIFPPEALGPVYRHKEPPC